MKNPVNIASDEKPLVVDAAAITGFQVYPDKKELSLYNEKGQLLWINYESFQVDPDKIAGKLAAAGSPLVYFPLRYEDKEYVHYIAPSAVTFATVTEPDKDGKIGAIVGVKGLGREESYGTKPEELQALLDAVGASGKKLLKFEPEEAHARWYNPAALYIDPATVTEIRDDGHQVNVYFDGSGSLDVQTRSHSDKQSERENELLNEYWNSREKYDDIKELKDAWRKAQSAVKAEETAARQSFANAVAAANGNLVKVPNESRALYIRPGNFDYISFYDDDRKDTSPEFKYLMTLQRQKTADNPYPEGLRAYFKTAAERAEAYAELTGTEPAKPLPPKKAPKNPKP